MLDGGLRDGVGSGELDGVRNQDGHLGGFFGSFLVGEAGGVFEEV